MTELLPAGTVIAERYELHQLLGAGGAGRVYAATDRRLDRRVAIKLVSADEARSNDPASTARFVDEARTGARFAHPHAITVFDAGSSDGYLYLVTELVEGPNLAEHIDSNGALAVDHALRVADQILGALGAAHAAGIVHRDVKPANVLLDSDGNGKLADFGIAKRLDDVETSLTADGRFVGTPRYASPEQAAGRPATAATDVYATGVVLYEMLTGRPPYDGDDPIAVATAHQTATIPDVRAARPEVPESIAVVVGRALAKSPAERFADASAFRAALAAAVAAARAGGHRGDTRSYPTAAVTALPPHAGARADERLLAMSTTASGPAGATSRRSLWLWTTLGGLVALVLAIAVLAQRNEPAADSTEENQAGGTADPTQNNDVAPASSPTTQRSPATTAETTTSPPTTPAPTTTAPPTTPPPLTAPPPPAPVDLASLIAFVEQSSDVGPRHGDLLDALRAVADAKGRDQRDDAFAAAQQIHDWGVEDELPRRFANVSIQILNDITQHAGDDEGRDKRDGDDEKGKGRGDD